MGGWKSFFTELAPKIYKAGSKVISSVGTKSAEQVTKVSKAELQHAKDLRKADAALKSIGNPKIKVDGNLIPRFDYAKGRFGDLKTGRVYTRTQFSQLQSHFTNLYKGGRTSGYKAWENSLPKASFKPQFNPVNTNVLKQEAKFGGQGAKVAAKETPKLGGSVSETVAKQRWYQNADNWKTAGQLGVKGMNKAGRAISGTAEFGYRAARGAIKNAKDVAILAGTGWAAYNIYDGNGVVRPLLGAVGGDAAQKGGMSNVIAQIAAGDGAPQLNDRLNRIANGVVNEAGDVYYRLKDGTVAVVHEARNLYQGGKKMVAGAFNDNGMVNDGNGYYSDPTAQQYPAMNQMMGQQDNGMVNGVMGGMNNALNTISGGNVSKMNLAGLLLSAYMMFGRFGWLGKAASLMLGGMTLKNINNHQSIPMQQGTVQQRNGVGVNQTSTSIQSVKPIEMPVVDDENVIVRSRGI